MDVFIIGLIAATLRVATPLILASIGEVFTERSGVLNLGIEGIMFFGAFVGFWMADKSGSPWMGLAAAIFSGMLAGLLMSLLSVTLGVNQHVSGLGITMLLTGLSLFVYRLVYGEPKIPPALSEGAKFQPITALSGLPLVGPIFEQHILTYAAIILVPFFAWLLYRTSFGLQVRAVGENPEAADAAGLNVFLTRYLALTLGGGLMALGGAFLSVAQLGAFSYGIVAGRGWVCIALVIFANWDPVRAMWGAFLFGGVFALQLRLQTTGLQLPYQALLSLPYLVTILALAIAGRNAAYPGAYLKPYRRE